MTQGSQVSRGDALIALADGRIFRGRAFGARGTAVGEVVFNTSLTGYQEILTDPSYVGQLVCLTVPEVGNVGCNADDVESEARGAEALIVRSYSPTVSNWRAQLSLHAFMEARGIVGISDVDTRALTRHVRQHGALPGVISSEVTDPERLVELARQAPSMEGLGLAQRVTTAEAYVWQEGTWDTTKAPGDAPAPEPRAHDLRVVALDFGIKRNILRCLADEGVTTTVLPASASADEILAQQPDGVLLSNGPGDPAALPDIIATIRELLVRAPDLPTFGICLGHQLLGLALAGGTSKLKFGHHGGNHPVVDERSGAVAITAQNHGFVVSVEGSADAERSHSNLFDGTLAGLSTASRPVFGVQYHPEASPGPHDAKHLFGEFAATMRERKAASSAGKKTRGD